MNESALFAITRLSMKSFSFPLIPPPFFSLPPLFPTPDTPSPSWLTDGGAGLSSGHICTVIFALFRCHLPLPDFSQIDTRVWLTDLPHPTSPRPGYILAPVKHSRTFPVLLEHFISPLCFYHLRSSSSSTYCLWLWKCQKCWYHSVLCVASYKMFKNVKIWGTYIVLLPKCWATCLQHVERHEM